MYLRQVSSRGDRIHRSYVSDFIALPLSHLQELSSTISGIVSLRTIEKHQLTSYERRLNKPFGSLSYTKNVVNNNSNYPKRALDLNCLCAILESTSVKKINLLFSVVNFVK